MRRFVVVTLYFAMLALGCRSGSKPESIQLDKDTLKSIDLIPAKALSVEYESKDNVPVVACLVTTEDATTALQAVEQKGIEKALATVKTLARLEQPKGTLTTPTTESKTKWSVLFYSKKPTTVTVTAKSK